LSSNLQNNAVFHVSAYCTYFMVICKYHRLVKIIQMPSFPEAEGPEFDSFPVETHA